VKFLIETCPTPIYNRITVAIANTLQKMGHKVYLFDVSGFSDETLSSTINSVDVDFYITTNDFNLIQKKCSNTNLFNFEKIKHKQLFIHHDSSFCEPNTIDFINDKITALKKHQDRIYHFFIERSNISDFDRFGIRNCYAISHASEFYRTDPPNEPIKGLTFVGHLMSNLKSYPVESINLAHHLLPLALNRLSQSTFSIQPTIRKLSVDQYLQNKYGCNSSRDYSFYQYLMHEVNKLTMPYRGELISKIENQQVIIFGGDLSRGTINNDLLILKKDNVKYEDATINYDSTMHIYGNSRISLNISSLQFDTGINNRIIDAILSGGFILTDRRSQLIEVDKLFEEITFDTPEEMNYKIDYYMDPANSMKYKELKYTLLDICSKNFTYQIILKKMLDQVMNSN
jgi:hypothetical protein